MTDNYNPTIDEMLLLQRELQELLGWLLGQSKSYTQFMRRGRKFAKAMIAAGNTSPAIYKLESFDPHNTACNDLASMLCYVDNWIDDYVDMLAAGGFGNSLFVEMKKALEETECVFSDMAAAWEKGYISRAKRSVFDVMDRLRCRGKVSVQSESSILRNSYLCSECGNNWTNVWSSACNDKCACGAEIEPEHSQEVNLDREPEVALFMEIVKQNSYESVQAEIETLSEGKLKEHAEWDVLNRVVKEVSTGHAVNPQLWQPLVLMLADYYDMRKVC